MKKLSVILALLALFFADLALAAGAVITSVTGTALVQTGSAAPRPLRQGDEANQGDTVSTGATSSLVMKFDDGQVAALTSNSRMTVTNYQYNAGAESGNVLLSLISGGMRTITGLIGRRNANNVAYRAATATIGIRGTDGTIVTNGTDVVITVTEGQMTVNFEGKSFVIVAGNAAFLHPGATPVTGPSATVQRQIPSTFVGAITESIALTTTIINVQPGTPRSGTPGDTGTTTSTTVTQSTGGAQGGGAGGGGTGTASGS